MYPNYAKNLQQKTKIFGHTCLVFNAVLSATNSFAEAPDWQVTYEQRLASQTGRLEIDADYVFGIDRFDTDQYTEIIGWQLGDRWYFGHQDGLDSGLTFVWQQNRGQQVSVSKDGLRLTRRF